MTETTDQVTDLQATDRDRILTTVRDMPSTSTFEEVMERLYLIQKIERGRRQIAEGEGVPQAEARARMKRWYG